MRKEAKIAIFDSGIGGLHILWEAQRKLPQETFVYFADSRNAPYGIRSTKEIRDLTLDAIAFLMSQHDLKAIVIACNTATSAAITALRLKYNIPIIGMEPAVKPAVEQADNKRILVFATELTLKEEKFHQLLTRVDADQKVDFVALQELVYFAENRQFDQKQLIHQYLDKKLADIAWEDYASVVLGCTHFPYFMDALRSFIPESVAILDGTEGTVEHLANSIPLANSIFSSSSTIYYYSKKIASPEHFQSLKTIIH